MKIFSKIHRINEVVKLALIVLSTYSIKMVRDTDDLLTGKLSGFAAI
jgi:hypothetical protein